MFARPAITTAIPAIERQSTQIVQSPKLLATAMKRNTGRLRTRWVAAKRVEPAAAANYTPLRYKSAKQRRKVHALRRERGGGAYQRTHELSRSAFVELQADENGGSVTTGYKSPIAGFVLSEFRQPMYNPALGGIPWQDPAETDTKFVLETQVVLSETWKTITDSKAGVR